MPNVLYVTLILSLVLLIVSPVLLNLQIYALNKVMTELEQQQFETFCKQMQSQGEWRLSAFPFRLDQDPSPPETPCAHAIKDTQPNTHT